MIIGSELHFYATVPSTNSEAASLLRSGNPPEGTVIYADFQTAGRGQPGKKWESKKGLNLLLSAILYPESILPEDHFLLTVIVSLAICDMLEMHDITSRIKWPNDIYFSDHKIAGVLIENSIAGATITSSITGIGLNINQEKFPSSVPNAISMKTITGKILDREIILKQLLEKFDLRYKQLLYGDRTELRGKYTARLYRFNEWHNYRSGNKIFPGKITGVSESGNIRIKFKKGPEHEFAFRELDYII